MPQLDKQPTFCTCPSHEAGINEEIFPCKNHKQALAKAFPPSSSVGLLGNFILTKPIAVYIAIFIIIIHPLFYLHCQPRHEPRRGGLKRPCVNHKLLDQRHSRNDECLDRPLEYPGIYQGMPDRAAEVSRPSGQSVLCVIRQPEGCEPCENCAWMEGGLGMVWQGM